MKLNIIIPMAGYGTRLRPQTWSKPKPLVSTAGKASLAHVLDVVSQIIDLKNAEISFIVGYQGEQVEPFMKAHFPEVKTNYYIQEEMQGQSHAIYMARDHLSGPTMVLFVDTLIDSNISIPSPDEAGGVVWVKEVEDPRRFGVVSLDKDKNITKLIEKPDNFDNRLAVIGYYFFSDGEKFKEAIETQLFTMEKNKGEHYIADAIGIMIANGASIQAQEVDVWMDTGTPEALLETNRYFLKNHIDNSTKLNLNESVVVNPPVFIHPEAEIKNSMIGPNVSIGPGCKVSDSSLQDSILEKGAKVNDSDLEASILGERSVVSGFKGKLNIGDDAVVSD